MGLFKRKQKSTEKKTNNEEVAKAPQMRTVDNKTIEMLVQRARIENDCFPGASREEYAKGIVQSVVEADRYEDCRAKLIEYGKQMDLDTQICVAYRTIYLLRQELVSRNSSKSIPLIDWLEKAWEGGRNNWIKIVRENDY